MTDPREAFAAWANPKPVPIEVEVEVEVEASEVNGAPKREWQMERQTRYVRKLTVGQAQQLASEARKMNSDQGAYAWLFCHYAVNADGSAMFDSKKRDDVAFVETLDMAPVKSLVDQAQVINGLVAGEKKA
jgi:hypothetical protein